jgi:AAA domain
MSAGLASLSVPFSSIPAKQVHWLHDGFVPFRHVTVVIGQGGTSKGICMLDYAARMTRGDPMPGEAECSYDGPMDVVVVLPEDDANEAVAGRLAGAGAVLDRVHNLTTFPSGETFTVPRDISLIVKAVTEIEDPVQTPPPADGKPRKVGMVILDPLLALAETDLRTRGQARPVMEALEATAKKLHLVILLTHHANADGKAASSRAITETARNVITLARLPKAEVTDPVRVLEVTKTNIGITGSMLRYSLTGPLDAPSVVWACEAPPADVNRGYELAAPAEATADTVPDLPPAAFRASVMAESGTAVVLGDFPDRELARKECEAHAGHMLTWGLTTVPGLEGAKVASNGHVTFYGTMARN